MADSSVAITAGAGTAIDTRTEGTNSNHRQVIVIGDPATNAGVAPVDATAGLKVDLGADNDVTVTGTVTANAGTNLNTSALAVETGGNLAAAATSLALIDNAVSGAGFNVTQLAGAAVPIGAGLEATAVRVTLATDSTGLVSVDDNGGSLTVDGTVSVSGAVDTELTTADLDTGAGTDTRAVVGLVYGASGGGVLVSTTNPLPVADNGGSLTVDNAGTFATQAAQSGTWTVQPGNTANTTAWKVDGSAVTQPVSGTVTANAGTGTFTVDSELPAAAALADATANPTTPLVGAALASFNGTTWDRVRGDTTNGLDVDVTRLPALVAGTANIGDVDVLTVPAPLSTTGGGVEATALRVTLASDSTGLVSVDDNAGSLTVDAPVGTPVFVRLSDGAAAISTLPVSLASVPSHAVTNAGTFAVQDTPAPVSTATLTSALSSTTSAQLLASTAGRRGLVLTNTDANDCYVKYGTTASATSFTVIIPQDAYWEMPAPIYTGRIDVVWAADGSGSLYATEMT